MALVLSAIMDREGILSTSVRSQRGRSKTSSTGCSRIDRPVDELSEQEFQAHFYISNSISILLSDGEASFIDRLPQNMIYFTNEQFVKGLHLSIPYFLKQFLHFFKISSMFIHSNVIRILMGCNDLVEIY